MKRNLILLFNLLILFFTSLPAQSYYVDANGGKDENPGTETAPFKTLNKAVEQANALTGNGAINIKLQPGIYLLEDRIDINPVRIMNDTARYHIAAAILPGDEGWAPEQVPIIQSIAPNNSTTQFPHSTGFLIASSHVTIKGIKFLGNPNPTVPYYYPISKEDPNLSDLRVEQCYFIGDKEAAKIQGGVWAHGPQNTVSHCLFYECRNAVLFFNNVDGFTIEHTIVYGSYESAFWFGQEDVAFTFTNNIIANNAYFLISPKGLKYSSSFDNSIITNNQSFVGYVSIAEQKILEETNPNIRLNQVIQTGQVHLQENNKVKLDHRHLHLTDDSAGIKLKAGIF